MSRGPESLADRVLAGDVRAAARLIRLVDDADPSAAAAMRRLYPHAGRAIVIGLTGSPGAGKSTLADQLVAYFRGQGKTVGVLAVDPTSPFSGGAILGDRIRMNRHATDPGVFIRSLATRGALGGLSRSTAQGVTIMDALGRDVILVETVGVGQDEVEVMRLADTTIVVVVPGMGDDVQAIKAGILEIAQVFVVNKADREGANRTAAELEQMLTLTPPPPGAWKPPILLAEAHRGKGIAEIVDAVFRHRAHLEARGRMGVLRRERARREFLDLLRDRLLDDAIARLGGEAGVERIVGRLAERETDPYSAVESVVGGRS
ncbi:MAG TPA: methylmalonyl Co-A mutase-associated GTPase MeaB [Thermodesulfobacteriota bacterium]